MRWFVFIALILAFPALGLGQQTVDTLIVGGNVFRTTPGTFEPNSGIAINDGRFIKTGINPKDFQAKNTIELKDDQYILPGLIDCHAHYNVRLIRKRREEFQYMPILYLANGATVTFSCGEFDPEAMYRLRKQIENGKQIGPRLINSGPYFGRARPGWRGQKPAQEIRDEVDFWAKKGVGGFKAKSIDPKSLQVLIDQAHKHGLTVTGHLDSGYRGSVNPRDAVTMGIDRIEHFLGGDAMPDSQSAYASLQNIRSGTPEFKKITQHFLDHKTVFDATLTAYGYLGEISSETHEEYDYWIDEREFFTPYMQKIARNRKPMRGMDIYQKIYRAKQKTIADFHSAGGTITLGTDHVSNGNFVAGFGVHRELDAFVRNGISPVDAIRIGTINGAKAFGIEKDHGSIEDGKIADLFVIQGNPLDSIRNTRNVQKVMRAGTLHDAKELLESVKGKLGPSTKDEEKNW
ncbi:MAG: amidohydrolase family protein [Planctomycetota bacterium]